MTDKQARVPGPDHPITIERNPARVVVLVAGRVIADTCEATTLREASYAPVHYVPRKDVDMNQRNGGEVADPNPRRRTRATTG